MAAAVAVAVASLTIGRVVRLVPASFVERCEVGRDSDDSLGKLQQPPPSFREPQRLVFPVDWKPAFRGNEEEKDQARAPTRLE